ncbi:PKD domain-containing protein [Haloparvum sedimenti]|uniref:PKD domain-containing protein n=1 Tax=Haloparvum sedimenti TaxID=1678448 RepID=UPI00071E7D77|nr:PKD domain-containing protein [Haloparvum sedimenti]
MRRYALALLFVCLFLGVPLAGAADAEAPLADAGLDQSVSQGTTVYLDGGGSHAPDGEIVAYEWEVMAPNGTTVATPTGRTPAFEAAAIGTYDVTLTVTDDAGRTASDTLHVRVSEGDPPAVALEGPSAVSVGDTAAFTAAIEPGDAPIDRVVWRVDGEVVETEHRPGAEATLNRTITTLDPRTVDVTVLDAADQSASDDRTVSVTEPEEANDRSGWYGGTAATEDPTIHGPQEVFEEEPLTATYSVDSGGGAAVAAVTWRVDGEPVATGETLRRTWEPGRHRLSALVEYRDGSKRVATFADGTREVVAKPPVDLRLRDLDGYDGTISGAVVAEDDLNALRSVEVFIDGELVERATRRGVRRHESEFRADGLQDNTEYEVTAVATDTYGQTVRVTETVEVAGIPHIESIEVLNTPVDSYHERIDPERYTATMKVTVDLNGYPIEGVGMETRYQRENEKELNVDTKEISNETLVKTINVAYTSPYLYQVEEELLLLDRRQNLVVDNDVTYIDVVESKPEARLNVHVEHEKNNHVPRIVIDASDSFDPDGTELAFTWLPDLVEESPVFSSSVKNVKSTITLSITDGHDQEVRKTTTLDEYYSPTIDLITHSQTEYDPYETLGLSFKTEQFYLKEENFEKADVRFELINGPGQVETTKDPAEQENRWIGDIETTLGSYLNDPVALRVYNAEHPEQTERSFRLPLPTLSRTGKFYYNIDVTDSRYEVESPVYDEVSVSSEHLKSASQDRGYSVTETKQNTVYTIQRHHEQDAIIETKSKEFDSSLMRRHFVRRSDGWHKSGRTSTRRQKVTTSYEWRSSISSGYTGRQRTRTIQSAEYRTEYQYRSRYGGTYWSSHAYSPWDRRSGSSRSVKVRDRVTETEYQHKETETTTVTEYTYVASKQVVVRPSISEWRDYMETSDRLVVDNHVRSDEYRVGRTTTSTTWTLRKQVGTRSETTDEVADPETVTQSELTVEGDTVYYSPGTDAVERNIRKVDVFKQTIVEEGFVSEREMIERFRNRDPAERDDCRGAGCGVK